MLYRFDNFQVDTDRRELRRADAVVETEPQVFELLVLLVQNHHRVVSKDELIDKIWQGRVVSDWAVSSRIKTLRKAVGDDGAQQRFVKTLRGHGLRFVGDVRLVAAAKPQTDIDEKPDPTPSASRRPSIAVLPFQLLGQPGDHIAIGDAIPRELIASLSSLRWLKVIAHGSTFRFRETHVDVGDVGRILDARYCVTGSVEILGNRIIIDTELASTQSREVIWALRRERPLDQVHELRAEIAAQIISVAEFEIPHHEALLLPMDASENLDAWSSLHIGIQHMNRLNPRSLDIAARMFRQAAAREPTLARAQAGLAFVHFLNAFLKYKPDVDCEIAATVAAADRALELQPLDPFANFVKGRSFWLMDDAEASKPWFERSIEVSPSYALGYFAAGWADIFTGDYAVGDARTDVSMDLSPLDPMRGGMLCNKMWVSVAEDDFETATKWAEACARTPGTHPGMAFFAAMANLLNGNEDTASRWKNEALQRNPDLKPANIKSLIPSSNTKFQCLIDDTMSHFGF